MSLRRRYLALAATWALAVLVCEAIHARLGSDLAAFRREAACLTVLFAALLALLPVRRFVALLPRPHAAVALLGFFAIMVGNLGTGSRLTFPFVKWAIYGRPATAEHLVFFELIGERKNGGEVELRPVELFPPLRHARIARRLDALFYAEFGLGNEDVWYPQGPGAANAGPLSRLAALAYAVPGGPEERRRETDAALRAMAAVHNRRHPESPIGRVRIEMGRRDWKSRPMGPVRRRVMRVLDLREPA